MNNEIMRRMNQKISKRRRKRLFVIFKYMRTRLLRFERFLLKGKEKKGRFIWRKFREITKRGNIYFSCLVG